jgi:protein phosphatase
MIREQYAAVGSSSRAALGAAVPILEQAVERGVDVGSMLQRSRARLEMTDGFVAAYAPYCWPVGGIEDVRLAPFQVLAGETGVHAERDHGWHMGIAERLAGTADGFIRATRSLRVDVEDEGSRAAGIRWWEELTSEGGEGMVVKPFEPIARGRRGLVQPGVKVRGREYLRLI